MVAEGCRALFPAERLAVMGLVEVAGRYFELRSIRSQLFKHFSDDPPDLFIGVDAPDFNLGLEGRLKRVGITTVHYVSPTVWAWREYRLHKIARSVDLMLAMYPFEEDYYHAHGVPVRFVGHPLADTIPLEVSRQESRAALALPADKTVIGLLPGSRESELRMLAEAYVRCAHICNEQRPNLHFVCALATDKTFSIFADTLQAVAPELPITLLRGRSQAVMAAADVLLVASGTATLEALLLKRPMVVAYKVAPLTYWLVKRMLKVPYCSQPNLLSGEAVVEEFIQDAATPENLARGIMKLLEHPELTAGLRERFAAIHHTLRKDASKEAAAAVLELVASRSV